MIKLKFKNKDKELDFFKKIPYLNTVESAGIRYADMINDLDVMELENDSDFEEKAE